jgi:hypothetical protein
MLVEAYSMYKMVRYIGCPQISWANDCVPFVKKSGQLMTHHSGQTPPSREACTRIEECRHTDTHHLTKHNI